MDWISVGEKLPDSDNDVIVWLGDDGYKLWDIGWYRHRDNSWIDSRDEVCYPTHFAEVTIP
jgi:hypothetical protein